MLLASYGRQLQTLQQIWPTMIIYLIQATLDDYLISRVRAFNDGFLPVCNN